MDLQSERGCQNQPIWADDVDMPSMPTLAGDLRVQVCVVGGGGSGLAGMDEALHLGASSVALVEGKKIASGAAGRNGGFLLAGLSDPYDESIKSIGRDRACKIYRNTLGAIERMHRDSGGTVQQVGSLRIEDDSLRWKYTRQRDALREDGFLAEDYEGSEGCGLLFPMDGVFHPMGYCREQLRRVLTGHNAFVFEHTPATKIEPGKVRTPHGTIFADVILAAIDGRLERVFPELVGSIQTYRLQMLATAPVHGGVSKHAVYCREGFDYYREVLLNRIAMGGCRDKFLDEERTCDDTPTASVQGAIESSLRASGISAPITHRWGASVAFSRSNLPLARQMQEGVLAVGGYSGTGNVLGREVARAAIWCLLRDDPRPLQLYTSYPR